MIVQVVVHAQVELVILIDVGRVGGRGCRQELGTPVIGQTYGEVILLVHQHGVGAVTEAGQRELIDQWVASIVVVNVTIDLGVVRQDAEAGVTEEVLTTKLPTMQHGAVHVGRLGDFVDVQRVVRVGGNVIRAFQRQVLGIGAVVSGQTTVPRAALTLVVDQRDRVEQGRVVDLAGSARLSGALGAVQEGNCLLRARPGGRVTLVVQALLRHRGTDEVVDALVPERYRHVAGWCEVPAQAEVQVVGGQRLQARVVVVTGSLRRGIDQGGAGRVAHASACVQVAVRRTCNGLAVRSAALQRIGEVDAEVDVGQQVAVAAACADGLHRGAARVLEVVVGQPENPARQRDLRVGAHVGLLVAHTEARGGRQVAQLAFHHQLCVHSLRVLDHGVVG